MYQNHSPNELPANLDMPIWRYINLAKFLDFLRTLELFLPEQMKCSRFLASEIRIFRSWPVPLFFPQCAECVPWVAIPSELLNYCAANPQLKLRAIFFRAFGTLKFIAASR